MYSGSSPSRYIHHLWNYQSGWWPESELPVMTVKKLQITNRSRLIDAWNMKQSLEFAVPLRTLTTKDLSHEPVLGVALQLNKIIQDNHHSSWAERQQIGSSAVVLVIREWSTAQAKPWCYRRSINLLRSMPQLRLTSHKSHYGHLSHPSICSTTITGHQILGKGGIKLRDRNYTDEIPGVWAANRWNHGWPYVSQRHRLVP